MFNLTFFGVEGTEEGFIPDESLFYGSTHGRHHYPGTGHDPSPNVGDKATREIDRRIVNRMLTPGPRSRPEFRVKWLEILAEMERFGPELVIMSTGTVATENKMLCSLSSVFVWDTWDATRLCIKKRLVCCVFL
jgi:acetoin utilization deacetylase AcuC-like enzyme